MDTLCKKFNKHKIRDNKFGVSWCVRCGRLFTKSSGKPLLENDKLIIKVKNGYNKR